MRPPTDKALIQGIRNHESPVLQHIYDTYYPIIEGYVLCRHLGYLGVTEAT